MEGHPVTRSMYPQVSPYVIDRAVEVSYSATLPAGFPFQTVGTYVVPAGKMAVLQYVLIAPAQTSAMTQLAGLVYVNRTGVLRVVAEANSVTNAFPRQVFAAPIGLILTEGNEVVLRAMNTDTVARNLSIYTFIDEIDL